MVNILKLITLTLTVITIFLSTSCSTTKVQSNDNVENQIKVDSIAMLPITTGTDDTAKSYIDTKKLEKGGDVLSSLLNYRFAENSQVTFISEEQIESLKLNFNSSLVNQNKNIGKLLHKDAVMTWNVNRYIERDGSDYSVDQPASVAFEYRLTHSDTGKTLCAGVYDETQKSLTDNLLSIKKVFQRGMKWISAKDLIREGINSKLETCQYIVAGKK